MTEQYHALPDMNEDRIVYIRRVAVTELPDEVRAQAGDLTELYAVHNGEGDRLALDLRTPRCAAAEPAFPPHRGPRHGPV